MTVVNNYSLALLFCVIAMICWGSWANTQKITSKKWRFELYYWDLTLGIFLTILIAAFTLGTFGNEGRSFITDLRQADFSSAVYAILGGVLWNIGNLCLVAAIVMAGMSVAFPIAGSVAWTLGIAFNYLLMVLAGVETSGKLWALIVGIIIVNIGMVLIGKAYKRKSIQENKGMAKGIIFSVLAGVFIAFFYGLVVKAIDSEYVAGGTGTMTPYTSMVFFAVGVVVSTLIANPIFMRYPVEGERISMKAFFKGTFKDHGAGFLGGSIWITGMVLSFMAVGSVNPVIGYALTNSAPVIAAVWGVFVWKEFKSAPKGTNALLALMFLLYIVGLFFITYSNS